MVGTLAGTVMALGFVLMTSPAVAEPASQAEVSTAREALEIHYLKAGVYDPVRCTTTQDETGESWIFCIAVGGLEQIGGLYLIKAGPAIWAVNGKAIQHIQKTGGFIPDRDLQMLPVGEWEGEPLDVPKALGRFQ